jgi:hypothetical protein
VNGEVCHRAISLHDYARTLTDSIKIDDVHPAAHNSITNWLTAMREAADQTIASSATCRYCVEEEARSAKRAPMRQWHTQPLTPSSTRWARQEMRSNDHVDITVHGPVHETVIRGHVRRRPKSIVGQNSGGST